MFSQEHGDLGVVVMNQGYLEPVSSWLPGTRKVNLDADPVELTSNISRLCGDSETYIKVKQLSASWGSEDDKIILKGISFELDKVRGTSKYSKGHFGIGHFVLHREVVLFLEIKMYLCYGKGPKRMSFREVVLSLFRCIHV